MKAHDTAPEDRADAPSPTRPDPPAEGGHKLRLLSVALETAANAVFITDIEGRIEYVNPAFEELTGYPAREAVGANPRILGSGRQDRDFYRQFWQKIRSGLPWNGQVVNRRKDGELFTVIQTVTPITSDDGRITHFVAIHEDVTARVEAERRIDHLARYDFLTDLPNRFTLNARLERETRRVARRGGRLAVLMLDLDHFKSVNDNFGHAIGDALLVEAAGRLRSQVRDVDTLARLGGDEFAVLVVDLPRPDSAAELATRLISCLAPPFELEDQNVYTSASVGIAVGSPGEADPAELLRQADLALYRAKRDGRNGYRYFVERMNDEIQLRMALGHDLHGALEQGHLFLEYQPQVDLRSRRIVGVEALLRWRHPQRGVVQPTDFVPIAESNGLIVPIGEWVLRTACGQTRAWQQGSLSTVPVAVNLSAVQLKCGDFVETVVRILDETGLEPRYLELELTETILMQGTPVLEKSLRALSELGVRISLDDFGRGYSSLEYLRRFPFNKLKIDRSFVRDVRDSHRDATILSAVISLATKLDLDVIAEGVGQTDVLDFLIAEGCHEAQSFYFGEPLPAREIARLLAEGSERIQPPRSD